MSLKTYILRKIISTNEKRLKEKDLPFYKKRYFRYCFIYFPIASILIVAAALLGGTIYFYLINGGF